MLLAQESKSVLKKAYLEQIVPELMKEHGYKNRHEVPKLEKIVINSAYGAAVDRQHPEAVCKDLTLIAGQKAVVTKARKSISNFKLREGMPIGAKVTLRGERMYDFIYRFVSVVLPLIRDFQGIGRKMDGAGNYTIGISDHSIFPEINTDSSKLQLGMDITFVTSAKSDEEGFTLLKLMGMPFRKPTKSSEEETQN